MFNINNAPDICIGIDNIYVNEELIDFTIDYFEKHVCLVEINYTYNGTIIPNKYLNKNDRGLSSIMLAVNKWVYLNSKDDFYRFKQCINDYYEEIKRI